MSCGPCKEREDCKEIVEDEDDGVESKALTELFGRLFDSRRDDDAAADSDRADRSTHTGRRDRAGRPAEAAAAAAAAASSSSGAASEKPPAAGHRCDGPVDESPMRRADRLLTALLRRRPGRGNDDDRDAGDDDAAVDASAEGDVTHLTARLPAFRKCRDRKPGTVNAALFGLDLEQRIAGDSRDDNDEVKRAAYDLAAAEAWCKHPGAVDAAELAVCVEPAVHLAETAARFGALWHTNDGPAGPGRDSRGGGGGGGDSPVVVVAYVGNTGPEAAAEDQ